MPIPISNDYLKMAAFIEYLQNFWCLFPFLVSLWNAKNIVSIWEMAHTHIITVSSNKPVRERGERWEWVHRRTEKVRGRCVCLCVCVFVCVCVSERDGETETERERQKDRKTETERQKNRKTEKQKKTKRSTHLNFTVKIPPTTLTFSSWSIYCYRLKTAEDKNVRVLRIIRLWSAEVYFFVFLCLCVILRQKL